MNLVTVPQLDIFQPPAIQTSVSSGYYTTFHSLTSLEGSNAPVEFFVPSSIDSDYIDLNATQLLINCKIVDKAGADLAEKHKGDYVVVAPINNFAHSIWEEVQLYLNGVLVTGQGYPYRALIDNVISMSHSAKTGSMSKILYAEDTPGHMESHKFKENIGLKTRIEDILTGYNLLARPHIDLCHQDRFLIPGVSLRFKFLRSKDDFALTAPAANIGHKIKITDAKLYIRHVSVSQDVRLAQAKALLKGPVLYPIQRVNIKWFTIGQGIMKGNIPSVITGQLPSRIILGFVENSSLNGQLDKNPYNFLLENLSELSLSVNQHIIPAQPFSPQQDGAIRMYQTLFANQSTSNENGITLQQYKNGYSLVIFNLRGEVEESGQGVFESARVGDITLNFAFSTATTKVLSAVFYCEYQNIISVSNQYQVTKDYAN